MNAKKIQIFFLFIIFILCFVGKSVKPTKTESDRQYWINILTKIADPVLAALSNEELHVKMPIEVNNEGRKRNREEVSHLEAFGRLMAGMAPWLELGIDSSQEGMLREKYIILTVKSITNAVQPTSKDFMNFNKGTQPLVDAAFLAHALIRAPKSIWANLDKETQVNLVNALKSTRIIMPSESNWLLFSAMVEIALLKFNGDWDYKRVEYSINKHLEWYKGDGIYGDGPNFHWDYYNSFVIQPMLLDILIFCKEQKLPLGNNYEVCLKRAQRYAEIQERLISPEGTFPPIGRSLAYRVGAFQLLGQITLMNQLPENINPAQVRCALTAVIKKMMEAPGTFDEDGWLRIGFGGHQPDIAEGYISTGSLYLCSVGFLPLGLKPDDKFWTDSNLDWTSKKLWSGENLLPDHAIND